MQSFSNVSDANSDITLSFLVHVWCAYDRRIHATRRG
jgi:hypothetical protein